MPGAIKSECLGGFVGIGIEAVNRSLRKIIKTRGSFPTDEAALKLLYLAIQNAGMRWRKAVEWTQAMSQFAILFGDRFLPSAR